MIKHKISCDEKSAMENFHWKMNKKLSVFNHDMANLQATQQAVGSLSSVEFLPTGPKCYQICETPQYKAWMAANIAHNKFLGINPKTGKPYFEIAPEYAEDSEVDEAKEMSKEDMDKITEEYVNSNGETVVGIKDDYDPNNSQQIDETDKLSDDEKHVFDFSLIKQKVVDKLDWKIDDIFDDIEASLSELHSDEEDYKTPENLREVVETIHAQEQIKMLAYKKEMAKLLENKKDSDKVDKSK